MPTHPHPDTHTRSHTHTHWHALTPTQSPSHLHTLTLTHPLTFPHSLTHTRFTLLLKPPHPPGAAPAPALLAPCVAPTGGDPGPSCCRCHSARWLRCRCCSTSRGCWLEHAAAQSRSPAGEQQADVGSTLGVQHYDTSSTCCDLCVGNCC
jgi:hypothetical protein